VAMLENEKSNLIYRTMNRSGEEKLQKIYKKLSEALCALS
jgi:hypothetical protein